MGRRPSARQALGFPEEGRRSGRRGGGGGGGGSARRSTRRSGGAAVSQSGAPPGVLPPAPRLLPRGGRWRRKPAGGGVGFVPEERCGGREEGRGCPVGIRRLARSGLSRPCGISRVMEPSELHAGPRPRERPGAPEKPSLSGGSPPGGPGGSPGGQQGRGGGLCREERKALLPAPLPRPPCGRCWRRKREERRWLWGGAPPGRLGRPLPWCLPPPRAREALSCFQSFVAASVKRGAGSPGVPECEKKGGDIPFIYSLCTFWEEGVVFKMGIKHSKAASCHAKRGTALPVTSCGKLRKQSC